MPTSLDALEVASPYGALDANAFTPGAFVHAHVLRELQRNGRRLAGRGEYLIQQAWRSDGADDVEATGGRMFDVPVYWRNILGPVTVPRKRHLPLGALQVRARITNGALVLLHVETRAVGRASARSSTAVNVLRLDGTGAWAWYTSDAIRLGRDDYDTLALSVTANATEVFNTSTFGTPDNGAPSGVGTEDFRDVTAAWNPAAFNVRPGLVVVEFTTSDGAPIVRRSVQAATNTVLRFDSPLSAAQSQACNHSGVRYQLLQTPGMRVGAIVLRERDGF